METFPGIESKGSLFFTNYTPFSLLAKFIKPWDLTYKSRLRTQAPYRKRPLVGPKRHVARQTDVFHKRAIDPVRECTNHVLLSHFVTAMGRIKSRRETGLTTKSQRRLGKAIRRAKMMGVIPLLSNASHHPSHSFRLNIPWRRESR
jgi:ribosomal protein S18